MPYAPTASERAAWQFPALQWLEEILSKFEGRAVLAGRADGAAELVPGYIESYSVNENSTELM